MNAVLQPNLVWTRCGIEDVDALLAIEQRVYSHPWSRGNFVDSLLGGHWAHQAWRGGQRCAYWVAMPVLDELHLLNLAVEPQWQRQGLGRLALEHLLRSAGEAGLREVWLEVRASNLRAQQLYTAAGFATLGRRRDYYPAGPAGREDALLMRVALEAAAC